jgi:DNA-binding transcriptional MocR family regulator
MPMDEPQERTSQVSPFVQTQVAKDCIQLEIGQPSPWLLPLAELHRTAARSLGPHQDPLLLQYANTAGHSSFRTSLAAFLSDQLGRRVDPDKLVVTGGNSLTISMVAVVLARPGAQVVCEDPTYFLARGIFEDLELDVRGIPIDRQGLQVDLLEERLRRGQVNPAFVYCIPSFQNPTGASLSHERAQRLLELSIEHDFYVVCDDPYSLLWFGDRPQAAFEDSFGKHPRLLELGSFSKILAPGLRLGWIEAVPELLQRYRNHGVLRSGGSVNPLASALVEPTLTGSDESSVPFLSSHIEQLRERYAERTRVLVEALRLHLSDADLQMPRGGYFLWLDLGDGADSRKLDQRARQLGVGFLPGSDCAIDADLARFARVSFAFYRDDELELAAKLLGQAWQSLRRVGLE